MHMHGEREYAVDSGPGSTSAFMWLNSHDNNLTARPLSAAVTASIGSGWGLKDVEAGALKGSILLCAIFSIADSQSKPDEN
jgi:hypothetical protein